MLSGRQILCNNCQLLVGRLQVRCSAVYFALSGFLAYLCCLLLGISCDRLLWS